MFNNVDVGDVETGTAGNSRPTDCGINYDATNNINKCGFAKPRAVDIDNDGDFDIFVGNGQSKFITFTFVVDSCSLFFLSLSLNLCLFSLP